MLTNSTTMHLFSNSLTRLSAIALIALFTTACSKDSDDDSTTPKVWMKVSRSIVLGDQANTTSGHFLKTKTGESIAVENADDEQANLSMVYYAAYGGQAYFTFVADAKDATAYPSELSSNRLFTQNPGGLNYWNSTDMNAGMIYKAASMTVVDFENVAASGDWKVFDEKFKAQNNGNESLSYRLAYELGPKAGNVYLIQINGLVRGFIYVKTVTPKSASGGSIKFDLIMEGRSIYANIEMAKNIQPAMPEE